MEYLECIIDQYSFIKLLFPLLIVHLFHQFINYLSIQYIIIIWRVKSFHYQSTLFIFSYYFQYQKKKRLINDQ